MAAYFWGLTVCRIKQKMNTLFQVKAAFRTLAGNKDYVVAPDLAAFVEPEKVQWFMQAAPKKADVAAAADFGTVFIPFLSLSRLGGFFFFPFRWRFGFRTMG
jgi:hypothetical protein